MARIYGSVEEYWLQLDRSTSRIYARRPLEIPDSRMSSGTVGISAAIPMTEQLGRRPCPLVTASVPVELNGSAVVGKIGKLRECGTEH